MAGFREAATGPGVIPWRLDLDRLEEDWFLPMAAPADGVRAISLTGARILARRLREAVAARHDQAMEQLARGDRSCPLDLHRLCPVPPAILQLGPDDPASRAWLWTHWGTTRALRHVRALSAKLDGRRKNGPAAPRLAQAQPPARARLRRWLSSRLPTLSRNQGRRQSFPRTPGM